jgi:hypothetical protein
MLAANRRNALPRIEIVTNVRWPDPHGEGPEPEDWNEEQPHFGPWMDFNDMLLRHVYVPNGMSVDEAGKIVGR